MVNYDYMRSKKTEDLKTRYERISKSKDNLSVELYKNAVILPAKKFNGDILLFGRGGLINEKGEFVEESKILPNVVGGIYDYDNKLINKIDKKVVFCGYLVNHWGHFLVESVCRLWYFLKNDETIDKYVFFIDENEVREIKGNFKEFFVLLGIWEKLEIINKPTQYREVVLPQKSCQRPYYYAQEYKDLFDHIASKAKINSLWECPKKVFFTRSQFGNAKKSDIANEMIDNYFKRNDFKVISPEKESLSYLIFLMQNASEFACIAGTLLLNFMFSKDNKKLIIIERLTTNNDYAVLTNVARNLDVVYIDAYMGIYSVDLGFGPYMHFYKGYLEKYTKDNNMLPPDDKYLSKSYEKKCFQKYMKIYKKAYGYSWHMYDWEEKNISEYRECYKDSLNYFGEYIYGLKPFKFSHYFQVRYIRQGIKRLIRR